MGYRRSTSQAELAMDSGGNGWHTLTLDAEGCITSGDERMGNLLGLGCEALAGQPVTTVFPDIPFSTETPGYNLAYAVFYGAGGTKVRRRANVTNGTCVSVDTVLSSRKVGGRQCITLNFKTTDS